MPDLETPGSLTELKERIAAFWDEEPCGAETSTARIGSTEYYREIERYRYWLEPHIPRMASFRAHAGQDVLEVGCGMGTDLLNFARSGARVCAIDLSSKSLDVARERFRHERLSADLRHADAEYLPFGDNAFDFVYSHGVLHHVPQGEKAIEEIRRVLKPGGSVLAMLYNRHSFNYLVDISVIRRLGRILLRAGVSVRFLSKVTGFDQDLLEKHQALARHSSLGSSDFLNNNTDGPGNPLSRVYSRREAKRLFKGFAQIKTSVHYFDRRHIPVMGRLMPRRACQAVGRLMGWHLYVSAVKPMPANMTE